MKKAKAKLDPTKLLGLRLYPESAMGAKTGSKVGQTKEPCSRLGAKIGTKTGITKGRSKIGAKIGRKKR